MNQWNKNKSMEKCNSKKLIKINKQWSGEWEQEWEKREQKLHTTGMDISTNSIKLKA